MVAQSNRQELARRGEDLAAEALTARGLEILARNYRFREGEIDIIARDGECVVFVEVKTRTGPFFPPCASVDGRKQRRLRTLATHWLAEQRSLDRPCRFDVVAVYVQRAPPHDARLEHIESAF